MPILLLAVVGVAAGFIAAKLMRVELSAFETIAIGLLGAVIGGVLLRLLVAASSLGYGLVGAVAGACLLIWAYQRWFRRRR